MSIRWSLRRLRWRYGRRLRVAVAAAVATLVIVLSTSFNRLPGGLQFAALLLVELLSTAAVLLLNPPVAGRERLERRRGTKRRQSSSAKGQVRRARARTPTLPPRDGLFAGRRTELAILQAAHDEARANRSLVRRSGRDRTRGLNASHQAGPVVVLIHGMPGVGKTALADELARMLASRYPDGQLFVNLGNAGTARTPNEILKELLLAFGWLEAEMPDTVLDRTLILRSLTAKRRILFVLDAAGDADQIRHVLPSDRATAVIVTSRRDLFLTDPLPAVSYALALPDEDDALSIFRSVSYTHDGVGPECVAEIVDLCGRLPLAIRSAAERVHYGTDVCHVADLLRSSRRRLNWLDQPGRSLRAHLDTEHARLLPLEQRALAMLSLVPSSTFVPWVLEPVMELPSAEAEALVDRLASANFLTARPDDVSGVTRYTFHPLVKLYADEQASLLSADHRAAAQHRLDLAYRELVLGLLRELHPDLRRQWVPPWVRDSSALLKRIAMSPETWFRNEYPSLLRVMALPSSDGDADSDDDRLDTMMRWRIGVRLGGYVSPGVSPESGLDAYTQAQRAAEDDGGGLATIDVLLARGTFLTAIERYQAAEECLNRVVNLAERLIERLMKSECYEPDNIGTQRAARVRIASAYRKLGEAWLQAACYRPAVEALEGALTLAEAEQDEFEQELDRILIADAYRVDAFEATFDQLQNPNLPDATRYRILLSLTEAARRRQEWGVATDYLTQAMRFVDGDLHRMATVQYRMACVLLDEHAYLIRRGEIEDPARAVSQRSLAVPAEASETAVRAVRRAAAAAVSFRRMDNPIGVVRARTLLCRAMLAIGRPAEAEDLINEVEGEYAKLQSLNERAEFLLPIAAELKRVKEDLRDALGDVHGTRAMLLKIAAALDERRE